MQNKIEVLLLTLLAGMSEGHTDVAPQCEVHPNYPNNLSIEIKIERP